MFLKNMPTYVTHNAKTLISDCQPYPARTLRCLSQRTFHVPKRDRRQIVKINSTAQYGTFETRRSAQAETVKARLSTALVPIERAQEPTSSQRHVSTRPDASFVAHLIATAEQAPQTRTLRRATPLDALVAYGRATAQATPVSDIGKMSHVA
jgi:hypothetical protein